MTGDTFGVGKDSLPGPLSWQNGLVKRAVLNQMLGGEGERSVRCQAAQASGGSACWSCANSVLDAVCCKSSSCLPVIT